MNERLNALQKELSAVTAFAATEISGLRAEIAKISLRIENVENRMAKVEVDSPKGDSGNYILIDKIMNHITK